MDVLEGTGISAGAADPTAVLQRAIGTRRFILVSNREPYEHRWDEAREEIVVGRPAGGLISALDPLMQGLGGSWIAWGSGDRDAEVVDEHQSVRVPPEQPAYTLRRLWLNEQDLHHYYFGYSNQFLWPLCHLRPALTRVRARYWDRYADVNRRFADAVLEEARRSQRGAAVWFHDYHLALAPAFVRERRPDLTLAHFWHIPFPPLELFRIATHGEELLRGLLACDLVGFHLPLFCDNFLRCVESVLGLPVDWSQRAVVMDGRPCYVRALPISIDVEFFRQAALGPDADARIERLRARYAPGDIQLGIGVDRIDYSKGLEEKLKALDLLWETYPELRERITYVQIAVPSRTGIEAYDWLNEKIERMTWSINDRYGTGAWRPVHLIKESLPAERLALYYRAADFAIISSLQDGMNLVAKEFIASQEPDSSSVLILSRFAGASTELDGAFEMNPFDPEGTAALIRDALAMPEWDRRARLGRLHGSLRTIQDWMVEVFDIWGAAARGEPAPFSGADGWSRTR
ncbi:MAG TPA: trehalose-6-phosphate synthase [Longimicrobiales bacterium]|nr:trehalose-6-phosphate synthase [Longimicrobiales bacterium]